MKTRRIYTNPDLCVGCRLCASACSVRKFGRCKPKSAGIIIWQDLFERFEGQRLCRHCDEPLCAYACMNGCISQDKETGDMLHDSSRCVGCWMCVMVCPFSAISKSITKEDNHEIKMAVRCDLCACEDEPHCVMVCPTGAIAYTKSDDKAV